VLHPRVVASRYFLFSIVFFSLPLCAALVSALERVRLVGATWLLVVVAVHLQQTLPFLEYGRGHYADAVRYIGRQTRAADVVVGSDHDVRNARVLAYYERLLSPSQHISYVAHADRTLAAPQWLILHAFEQPPAPRPWLVVKSGAAYRWRKTFPYWGPSGFHWFVYEHVALPAAPPT
jgi:hypothetical protein